MEKKILVLMVLMLVIGCNNLPLDKPDNLIEEEKMTNILYDLTLLDAVKSQNPYDSVSQSIKPRAFIYKKYSIDSLQFVTSNQFYISQISTYKKMYDEINQRLQKEKSANDLLLQKGQTVPPSNPPTSDTPQVQ